MTHFIEQLESRTHLSLPGDANQDGIVNSVDFAAVAVNYNQHPRTLAQGDFTGDALVNALDFNVLAANFGRVEPVSLTDTTYFGGGGSGGSVTDNNNWDNGIPDQTKNAIFNASAWADAPTGSLGTRTIGKLSIINGGGLNFGSGGDVDLSGVTVDAGDGTGDANVNNVSGWQVAGFKGNFTGTGNTGQIVITLKTGTGKTINNDASSIEIVALGTAGAAASITIGASVPSGGLNIDAIPNTASSITWSTTSQGGAPNFGVGNGSSTDLHGTFISNKTSGACAVNAGGLTLPADATLTSQLNGVTVTNGTGGTFSNFTMLRTAGQQAKYAAVTGGVEHGHASGGTISGTYDGSFGFVPAEVYSDELADLLDSFACSGGTSTSETWSAVLKNQGVNLSVGTNTLSLRNDANFYIDTITVTAAGSGQPANKLSLGISLGI